MTEDLKEHFSGLWTGFRKKALETVASQEAAFSRGKVAGSDILADDGTVIVHAGHTIDDRAIERAQAAGRLHALAASVAKAGAQDLRQKAKDTYDRTPDGIESRSLNSVDHAIEARRYEGSIAGLDVTDNRGNVIIEAGKTIRHPDIDRAREAGVLGALIYSAQQLPPELPVPKATPVGATPRPGAIDLSKLYAENPPSSQPQKRASLPLVPLPESFSDRE
jgi:hypothetical protein